MNIKSPLPGNDVGYKEEGSTVPERVYFCMHVRSAIENEGAEGFTGTLGDVGGGKERLWGGVTSKHQVNQTKQLVRR